MAGVPSGVRGGGGGVVSHPPQPVLLRPAIGGERSDSLVAFRTANPFPSTTPLALAAHLGGGNGERERVRPARWRDDPVIELEPRRRCVSGRDIPRHVSASLGGGGAVGR